MLNRKFALWLGLVPLALGAMFLVACGGDDDDGGGGGSGSDEDFVSDLCKASADFLADIESAGEDIDPSDLDAASKAIAGPFEDFAGKFKDLNPPDDLEEWHNDASDSLDQIVQQVKDGDFESALGGTDPLPELPDGPRERLGKIADENEDCKEAGGFITE